jgi:hypothetical protein
MVVPVDQLATAAKVAMVAWAQAESLGTMPHLEPASTVATAPLEEKVEMAEQVERAALSPATAATVESADKPAMAVKVETAARESLPQLVTAVRVVRVVPPARVAMVVPVEMRQRE